MAISSKQLIVLDFIKEFIAKNGFSPTIREISEGLGLKSHSTVQEHLRKLTLAGLIAIDKNKSRTIELLVENEYLNEEDDIISVPLLNTKKDDIFKDFIKTPKFLLEDLNPSNLLAYNIDNTTYIVDTTKLYIDKPSLTKLENEYLIETKPLYKVIGNIVCELKKY